MKYEVFLSEQAEQDIRNIYEYIAIEKQAPEVARALILRIEEQILRLDEMPYRFREYENEPWKSRGMRIMPVENFLICYNDLSYTKLIGESCSFGTCVNVLMDGYA